MLSAIILAPRDFDEPLRAQEAVVRTLGVLVGAAVADLVRDACIAGPAGLRLESIADHAGCAFVEDESAVRALDRALATARCEHVLILRGGYAPGYGFIDEASDWLALRGGHAAASLRDEGDDFLRRLFPRIAPVAGLLARKSDCLSAGADTVAPLARKLRARILHTRARRLV